jgi:hypothetical protein
MNILYNREKKTFFHVEESIKTYKFAKNSFLLSSKNSKDCYQFTISPHQKNIPAIPLIGIVASKEEKNKYKGNFELFRSIQLDVEQAGGVCFVFSPQDVFGDSISGIMYNQPLNKWVK